MTGEMVSEKKSTPNKGREQGRECGGRDAAPYCVKGFFPIKSRFFNLTVLNE